MYRKLTVSLLLLVLTVCEALAKDIDLKSRGAKADGKTKVTALLQKAIDDVSSSGGGRVILSGGVFLTAPVELKSGVELHIEADATLLASADLSDYPERTDVRHYLSEGMPRFRNVSIIYADEAENIAITGRGTIDCNGTCFVKEKTGDNWKGWHFERTVPRPQSLPRAVFFAGCRNITVTDVTMTNQPAGWSYWIHDCDVVHFDRCKILADVRYPNNDGIHLNCSRDVTVSNCFIETGDDAVIIRANSRSLRENKPCERVVITNCVLRSWDTGVRIGWTNDGVIRNCSVSNIQMYDCSAGICLYLPSFPLLKESDGNDYGREASLIEDISFSNIRMDHVFLPVFGIIDEAEEVRCEAIRNISFSDMNVSCLYELCFKGREGTPIEEVSFNNCTFEILPEEEFPDGTRHGWVVRPKGNRFAHVVNLRYDNCRYIYR